MGLGVFLLMLKIILLCFLSYFGAAYSGIRFYELLTFYVPFSRELVSGGVYSRTVHSKLMKERVMPLCVIFLGAILLMGLLIRFTTAGFIAAIACFAAGLVVYYQARLSKKALIRGYIRQYRRYMDESRLNVLLQEHYGMSVESITVRAG